MLVTEGEMVETWKIVATIQSNHIDLVQYHRHNNVVFSGIPENLSDNNLESTVISALSDIDIEVKPRYIEACHQNGKPTSKHPTSFWSWAMKNTTSMLELKSLLMRT